MQRLLEVVDRILQDELLSRDQPELSRLLERLHVSFLRRAMREGDPEVDITEEELAALRRIALYLEAEVTIDPQVGSQRQQDTLYVAASIFEFIGQYQLPIENQRGSIASRLATGDLADYLRSMVLYSLSRFESNGAVIGRRMLMEVSHRDGEAFNELDERILLGLSAVVHLVARNLTMAISASAELGRSLDRIREHWNPSNGDPEETRFFAIWIEICEGISTIAFSLLTGSDPLFRKGRDRISSAAERALALRNAFGFWTADRIGLICDQMLSRSVYRVLQGREMPLRYVSLVAATGAAELWTSQIAVIEAGLLETNRSFVVNLPTGAGKSLLAEMAIVKSLLSENQAGNGWGVYVVPTRALVRQVDTDLRKRLPLMGIRVRTVLAGAEPTLLLNEEVEELAKPRSLTVLTPEKLDVYFRSSPDLFSSCKIMILDEAHKVGDSSRGALVDSLVTRLKIMFPEMKLLFLSAVLSNVLEIAAWLGDDRGAVQSDWRPTRQLKGIVFRQLNDESIAKGPTKSLPNRIVTSRSYSGGVLFVDRASQLTREALQNPSERVVDNLYNARVRSWRKANGSIQNTGTTATDIAAELTESFSRLMGVTVAFLGRRASAEKCARLIASSRTRLVEIDEYLSQLINHMESILGPQHELNEMMRRGVAYHHAGLPTGVRRVIESALIQGGVDVLCATPTLQEGLNSPATTVIIVGTYRWDSEIQSDVPMTEADFSNIAGRAGRAGRETEGQVVLLPSPWPQNTIEFQRLGERYFFPSNEALRVLSAFVAIERELEAAADVDELFALSNPAQTTLLALHAAGYMSEESLFQFFDSTLATRQFGFKASAMASTAHRMLESSRDELGPERINAYSRTALPFTDCTLLESELRRMVAGGYDLSSTLMEQGEISFPRVEPLLDAVLNVPRFRAAFPSQLQNVEIAHILVDWMNGHSYFELASVYFSGNVEGLVSLLGAAGGELSWGLGSAFLFIELIEQGDAHPEIGLLPLFVEFGVNNASAAFLSLLGVSERESANDLALTFDVMSQGSDDLPWQRFEGIEDWIRTLTREEIRQTIGEQPVRSNVLLRDLGLGLQGEQVATFDRLRISMNLTTHGDSLIGEVCAFRQNPEIDNRIEVVGSFSGSPWGQIISLRTFNEFSNNNPDSVFGIAVLLREDTSILELDLLLR